MKSAHQIKFLSVFVVSIFLYACSPDPEIPLEETIFTAENEFTNEGFAGQPVKLVISRNNSNKAFPLKSDLIVFFGTEEAEIDAVITKSLTRLEVDVIVPSGYMDETVDITVKTLSDQLEIGHFENAFTFKTPQITEVQGEVPFDSAFRIKMINRPADFQNFYISLSDGISVFLEVIKTEGNDLWLKCNAGHAIIKYEGYAIKADINEKLKLESSDKVFFRSAFKTERRTAPGIEVFVLIAFNVNSAEPIVKLNDIILPYKWTWQLSTESYEFGYSFPEGLEDGEYEISVTQNSIPFIPLEGPTYTYDGAGPGIVTYTDIKLGGTNTQNSVGSVFSTATGMVYTTDEISTSNAAEIDILFVGIDGMRFFTSPDDASGWGITAIPNASRTNFINYMESSDIVFTEQDFDGMTDDDPLDALAIENDDESFPATPLPRIVLFENAMGRKGAIKIKEIVTGANGYVIFDLKVEE